MIIRPASRSDYAEYVRLERQIAQMHCDAMPGVFKPVADRSEKEFCKLLKDADWALLVAAQGATLLGIALSHVREQGESATQKASRILELNSLCVDEACREQGIGTQLIDATKKLAKERGLTRLELNVWGFNEGARRLYEREGFGLMRTWMGIDVERYSP
ncbi:MAG: GNAT family N-acetyltransferase [Oscillospiraceae bacterium]|jgi:ribosomal protein S18 acetylase RimI-like enzyme|nr:GNAT family N-acetyltransferase [Oscillospiraceae bacterium]